MSLDDLFAGPADPAPAGVVFQPPCRMYQRPVWEFLHRVVFGDWAHTWRALLLLVAVAGAVSGVLLAGSVALKAAALSLAGLVLLIRMSKVPRGPVHGA